MQAISRFIFVRHGHYDGRGRERRERERQPLTEHGRRAAQAAGKFLRNRGVAPDLLVATRTKRTLETASIIKNALGHAELNVFSVNGGFSSRTGLDARLAEWIDAAGGLVSCLALVGHGVQQRWCLEHLPDGPAIPRENRGCVLVYGRHGPGAWQLLAHHAGVP